MIIKYTIGAFFSSDLREVVMILKNRPEWQKGLWNLPGGHVEPSETSTACMAREFGEECGVWTRPKHWTRVGSIINKANYKVDILTMNGCDSIENIIRTTTDEKVAWCDCNDLPDFIISNLKWIIPFCRDSYGNNSPDIIKFGTFKYIYPKKK